MWEVPEVKTLDEGSVQMHELYHSLLRAGFTIHEAMHVLMQKPDCDKDWTTS